MECPFSCGMQTEELKTNKINLEDHIDRYCTSPELQCPTCNINVYSIYKDLDFNSVDPESGAGHDCIRDLKDENQRLKQKFTEVEMLSQSCSLKISLAENDQN